MCACSQASPCRWSNLLRRVIVDIVVVNSKEGFVLERLRVVTMEAVQNFISKHHS
jgi:hypothetical protein